MAQPSTYAPPPKSPRYMRIVPAGSPLLCPRGHRMREGAIVLEHAGISCRHRLAQGHECGAFVWVLGHRGWHFIAEVTILELRHMQTQAMDVSQSLRFLGLDGPLTQTPETR